MTTRRANGPLTVLALQGGGALGAYQAGAYEALVESGREPQWLAGISIGAINSALIAGSPPKQRVAALKTFWDLVSSDSVFSLPLPDAFAAAMIGVGAVSSMFSGVPGFFRPRVPPPWFRFPHSLEAISFYDTTALEGTLGRLVDFERLNHDGIRVSVGAVNVRTGNFAYFDTAATRVTAKHIMASGALPPGFPPIEIDGEYYWDGGLVSNTPLQYALETEPNRDLLAFQVDLFSARGDLPDDMANCLEREKDIRYSSRTRFNNDQARRNEEARKAFARLLHKLPRELDDDPDLAILKHYARERALTIVNLIYKAKAEENYSKDYQFSRYWVERHWKQGYADARATLDNPEFAARCAAFGETRVLDLTARPPTWQDRPKKRTDP